MTFVNERHIGRDGQGRIYEERWLLVPKGSGIKSSMNWIQIADAKQHTLYNCSPRKHICELLRYDGADDLSAVTEYGVWNLPPWTPPEGSPFSCCSRKSIPS